MNQILTHLQDVWPLLINALHFHGKSYVTWRGSMITLKLWLTVSLDHIGGTIQWGIIYTALHVYSWQFQFTRNMIYYLYLICIYL